MLLQEMMTRLREPVNAGLIKQKMSPQGNVDYIPWVTICDLLDARVGYGNWKWEIVNQQQIGDRYHIVGRLFIHGSDRSLFMDATGCEVIDCESPGDPSSNAEAMALRRAGAKLGLARELWQPQKKVAVTLPPIHSNNKEISREEWMKLRGR